MRSITEIVEAVLLDENPPPPPVELGQLQERRNAIVEDHRVKLQIALGAERFQLVDEKVKSDFAKNFKQIGDLTPSRGNQ